MDLASDEVDAITGPGHGPPKSATFRTLDLVGLDTFVHVAKNVQAYVSDPTEKAAFMCPRTSKNGGKRVARRKDRARVLQTREDAERAKRFLRWIRTRWNTVRARN